MNHPFERFNPAEIKLVCETDGERIFVHESVAGYIIHHVADTRDRMVRETLIKLGWSPPERTQELVDTLLRINEEVWPLVYGLTGRRTLRDFMRTLPDIINRRPT